MTLEVSLGRRQPLRQHCLCNCRVDFAAAASNQNSVGRKIILIMRLLKVSGRRRPFGKWHSTLESDLLQTSHRWSTTTRGLKRNQHRRRQLGWVNIKVESLRWKFPAPRLSAVAKDIGWSRVCFEKTNKHIPAHAPMNTRLANVKVEIKFWITPLSSR